MNASISSYFDHIGFTAKPVADLETLRQLHLLHTLKIPFENLNPFLDTPVSLEFPDLIKKMIEDKRGGYCFEHNTLFLTVLREIGFKAKGLGARVLWNEDENLITRRSHMLIAIEFDQKTYLADVGSVDSRLRLRFCSNWGWHKLQLMKHLELIILEMTINCRPRSRMNGKRSIVLIFRSNMLRTMV